jgi:hypothetical protein
VWKAAAAIVKVDKRERRGVPAAGACPYNCKAGVRSVAAIHLDLKGMAWFSVCLIMLETARSSRSAT